VVFAFVGLIFVLASTNSCPMLHTDVEATWFIVPLWEG
jgi:hypothetical protein